MITQPFAHQLEALDRTWQDREHAIFWEQGTGKTWLGLGTYEQLAIRGEIRGALILAPNGVHRVWAEDEVPTHLGPNVEAYFWTSSKARTKKHERMAAAAMHSRGCPLVAMSYDGFMTPIGRKWAQRFLETRRVLMICD